MEKNRILFSPVGHTDPVKSCRDGALLHICRNYHPAKVYLFYSKEMCEIRAKDNRYEFAIQDLNQRLGLNIQCEAILRPELEDVQKFDLVSDMMKSELDRIHRAHPDDEFLLNVSSGTPAMKGALILVANLLPDSYHLKAVQVSAPADTVKKKELDNKEESANIMKEIRDNTDFAPDAEIRSYTESKATIYAEIIKKDICAHIDAYDYAAALRQVAEMKDHNGRISERAIQLLEAANARLNEGSVTKLHKALTGDEKTAVFSQSIGDLSALGEYAMWMLVKLKSKQSADFIRGITPICYELPIKYLKYVLGKDITTIRESQERGDFFDFNKKEEPLYQECMAILNKKFARYGYDDSKPWSSEILIELVNGFHAELADARDFKELREYEQSVRNKVAHTIFKPKNVKHHTNLTIEDVWERLCRLLRRTFGMTEEAFEAYLGSYDAMNEIIKREVLRHIEGAV